ncbi:hypothetical protein myaer102_18510 [Microcystis viridis NIES-102]|uniref:Uncharacterized protein n=1 Tax=Microcystis viridis NIES-102 TaxID=213615 RepID=A0A3G9JN39_MICVR|nr:hypothetical protein [Microcystis viridis]BBH39321.1 hypothetical protein myaer102_18510 [Microcystis viridis NIES-102]
MPLISLADIRGGKTETHVNVASLYASFRKMVTLNSTASKIVTDEQRGTSKMDDAPPLGTLDPEILDYVPSFQRLLVTNNRRSMPRHLKNHWDKGGHIWG